jgi:hypothetical protein
MFGSQPEQNKIKLMIAEVYRGKVLSKSVLQQLIDNIDGLISMNGFLSTTIDPRVADIYAGDDEICDGLRCVQFQLQINKIRQPYVYISDCILQNDELEVLFSVGTC